MKIWNFLLIISFILLLNSCASFLNGEYVRMDIHTTEPTTIIFEHDTLQTENNKAKIYLERKREAVQLIAKTDSISKVVKVKSRLSPVVIFNLPFFIGLLVDANKDKVFEYPYSIQLDMSSSSPLFYSYGIPEKGDLYFNFTIPTANSYLIRPFEDASMKRGGSYLGAGLSLEYYLKNDMFLNTSFIITGNSFLAGALDQDEYAYAYHFGVTNNHRKSRCSYGYGLAIARRDWGVKLIEAGNIGFPINPYFIQESFNLEAEFNGRVQLSERFYVGLVYRPTLLKFNSTNGKSYEHFFSVEFSWKFPARKRG